MSKICSIIRIQISNFCLVFIQPISFLALPPGLLYSNSNKYLRGSPIQTGMYSTTLSTSNYKGSFTLHLLSKSESYR